MNQNKYKLIKLSDYCVSVFDGTHDSPKYCSDGYHLVTSKHLGFNINVYDAPLISKTDFDKINERSKVEKNDVLISLIGSVGIISLIKTQPNFAIKNVGVLRGKSELDAKYIYFYMQSQKAQNDIKGEMVGSTQPFLSLGALRNFNILVPEDDFLKQYIVNTISILLLKFL